MKWKIGDKCYWEFKFGEVVKAEDGTVTELSDGCLHMSGRGMNDLMQPNTKRIKKISEEFEKYYDKINHGNCGLNHPSLHRWFVIKWVDTCNGGNIKRIRKEVKALLDLIEQSVNNVFSDGVNSLYIFNRNHLSDWYKERVKREKDTS